jgi:hypothetical protein
MKPHRILKGFKGSQTGVDSDEFHADTVRDLSDSLAAIAVKEGWARPHLDKKIPPQAADEGDAPDEGDQADAGEKSEGDAPANKAKKAAPENKAKK